jgi:hypothetical protein
MLDIQVKVGILEELSRTWIVQFVLGMSQPRAEVL